MVDDHRFIVTLVGELHLLYETVILVDGVVELAVGVRQLFSVHHQLESFRQSRFGAVHLRQRTHLDGIIDDEGRLDEGTLTGLAEDLVNQLTLTHMLCVFDTEFLGLHADGILVHVRQVQTRLLFDGIQNRQTAVRRFEIHFVVTDLYFRRTVHGDRDALQQLLRKRHHPVIVFVLYIELHAGKLGVVGAVHTFVAEVTADLIHAFKTTNDESLQVQLRRDAQVHIYIERVMMRDKRTSRCTTGYLLQDRRLYLRITRLVEYLTHRAQDRRAFQEGVLHSFVDYQVHIPLTITLLGIIESVVRYAVFVFDDRQGSERFREHGQFLCVYADLTHLRAEYKTLDTDEVTDIQQFLEYHIVHLLLYGCRRLAFCNRRLDVITGNIHLNTTLRVLQLDERSLTHDTLAHQSSRNAHRRTRVPCGFFVLIDEISLNIRRKTCYYIFVSRVGIDTHLAHRLQALPTNQFLFA